MPWYVVPHLIYWAATGMLVLNFLRWRGATPLTDEQIFDRLWGVVRSEQVPVLPREWGAASAGIYSPRFDVIWLLPKYYRNPWVLAHELGHRSLYKEGKVEHGEEDADDRGRAILLSVLSRREARALRARMDIYLPRLGANRKSS